MGESGYPLNALLASEHLAPVAVARSQQLEDEFLETLAHELRTPVNAILDCSRLLQLGRLGAEEAQDGSRTIARNARMLARIVDDLLDLAALRSGKIRVDPEETDVCEIAEAVLEVLKPAAHSKGVHLEKHLMCAGCQVFGDPQRLQQVMWHLLANSIKFTPLGGRACITVQAVGAQCRIVVEDTGTGIASERLPFVFERFWRAETSEPHPSPGLGVGLALVKRFVELHGGEVTASSAGLNRGATFTVMLPRMAPRVE